eukprot:15007304-Alexandrium_andersonii.AAC.2
MHLRRLCRRRPLGGRGRSGERYPLQRSPQPLRQSIATSCPSLLWCPGMIVYPPSNQDETQEVFSDDGPELADEPTAAPDLSSLAPRLLQEMRQSGVWAACKIQEKGKRPLGAVLGSSSPGGQLPPGRPRKAPPARAGSDFGGGLGGGSPSGEDLPKTASSGCLPL